MAEPLRAVLMAGAAALSTVAAAEPSAMVQSADVLPTQTCADGVCRMTLSPAQLLAQASRLVAAHEFDAARPLVAALSNVPAMNMEQHFLTGYIAIESGDLNAAIREFRAALSISPKQTRIRLELARALMMQGNRTAADYHFRLAQQADDLPPEIAATIRASRGLLRDSREFHLSTSFGLAPDTNITNGTAAQTVDLIYGTQSLPLTLDANARKRSGIGQTGNISAGWRGQMGEDWSMLVDVDGQGTNYEGTVADDFSGQIAAGPEYKLSETTQLSVQALGSRRWYGGKQASTQFGTRIALQSDFGRSNRAGLTVDLRHTASRLNADYTGWSYGLYASYERVMMRSMVASATLFGRADTLNNKAYSSRELGVNLGIGGEWKHGINAGISGGVSRAVYAAPLLAFSTAPRRDWRFNARVYLGLRSVRVLGFSPSITYSYSRNGASLPLYASERSRFAFELARYF